MTHAIEATGLTKRYRGGVVALQGLSFAVPSGTVFGLLGPNGAGKSTAVKVLATLTRADDGQARVAGLDVRREPAAVRRVIGYVSQKAGIDLEASGRENLTLQGRIHGIASRPLRVRVDDLLERFGLASAAGRLTRTYSGGMQRRLDIAMGLVHRPAVLFLDEPTTGLDPEVRAEMWAEISHLAADEGLTILLTTHYLEEADHLAGRLAIVDHGRVVARGTPDDLKAQLDGDAVHVELATNHTNGKLKAAFATLREVRDVVVDGRHLHARVENGARAVPLVLQALEARGVPVSSVTVARPSLDDVYLRFTGRTFARAEAEAEEMTDAGAKEVKV